MVSWFFVFVSILVLIGWCTYVHFPLSIPIIAMSLPFVYFSIEFIEFSTEKPF